MSLEEKMCVEVMYKKNSKVFDGVDLTKVDWFALLQEIQIANGEMVEEEEEFGEDDIEGMARFRKDAYRRVRNIICDYGVELPEEYPG